jgi:hypothetical protein
MDNSINGTKYSKKVFLFRPLHREIKKDFNVANLGDIDIKTYAYSMKTNEWFLCDFIATGNVPDSLIILSNYQIPQKRHLYNYRCCTTNPFTVFLYDRKHDIWYTCKTIKYTDIPFIWGFKMLEWLKRHEL